MKKSGIYILITITLVFAAFVAGIYVGRNMNKTQIQVSSQPSRSTAASTLPSAPSSGMIPESTGFVKVNINLATMEELQAVPGIGPSLARNIVQYRMTYGYFHSLSELTNVPNFGEKRLEALLPYITI